MKIAPIMMLIRGEDKNGGVLRGFVAAQIVVSSTIQTDLVSLLSQIMSKEFLDSPKTPKTLSVAKGRSCKMNTINKVREENSEGIVMDNEMMDYE